MLCFVSLQKKYLRNKNRLLIYVWFTGIKTGKRREQQQQPAKYARRVVFKGSVSAKPIYFGRTPLNVLRVQERSVKGSSRGLFRTFRMVSLASSLLLYCFIPRVCRVFRYLRFSLLYYFNLIKTPCVSIHHHRV